MKTKLDSVIANVYNLDQVLAVLKERLNLSPFLTNTITIEQDKKVRMALVSLSNGDFEFIECAEQPRPAQMCAFTEIHIECPMVQEETCIELEEGLSVWAFPGAKPMITMITAHSTQPAADTEVLLHFCDNSCEHPLPDDGKEFVIEGIKIHFISQGTVGNPSPLLEDFSSIHGWHRFSLKVHQLEPAVDLLEKAGARTIVPIFAVMPGLREAILTLPSGLIIQPVEQKLLKMMPHFLWQKLTEKKEVEHG